MLKKKVKKIQGIREAKVWGHDWFSEKSVLLGKMANLESGPGNRIRYA